MTEHLAPRIEALETRIAHQDRIIEDLNAALTAQWRKIDALTREIARLGDRMQDISRPDSQPEAPPPHY